jgi:hypothetical protein
MTRNSPQFLPGIVAILLALWLSLPLFAQSVDKAKVPADSPARLVNYSGRVSARANITASKICGITFAVYSNENGDAPLWLETQNVALDESGRYTVLLGATTSGLPPDLFPTDEQRWLGVQVEGQAEQPRVLLASVPYSIRAVEAERLAGHEASEFVTTETLQTAVQQQLQQQTTTITPAASPIQRSPNGQASGQSAPTNSATDYIDNTSNQVVSVVQNGSGVALKASAPSNSAIVGAINATLPSGIVAGVAGVSSLDSTFGIYGRATSSSSTRPGIGAYGQSDSPNGIGLEGIATGNGNTIGLLGQASSSNGFAIDATETATSGNTAGMVAQIYSPAGIGALIMNNATGPITGALISARTKNGVQFSVDGTGNVNTKGTVTTNSLNAAALQVAGPIKITGSGNTLIFPDGTTQQTAPQVTLGANLFTGKQQAPALFGDTSLVVGSVPAATGQVAIMPDDLDTVHQYWQQAGHNMHFRLSSAQPGPGGTKDFIIAPYTYGMAIEYAGVLEAWVDDFSVHTNHRFQPISTPARFWVGDEGDTGGLFVTAYHNGGKNSYTVLASDRFAHTSHGPLVFQVRDPADTYNFQWGAFNSEVTRASFSNTATATNLNLTYGPVQGIVGADSSNNGAISVGSVSATPVSLVAGSTPKLTVFPDGNVSIGNTLDSTRLSVGSSGLFSVNDAGAVTAASLNLTGSLTMAGSFSPTNINASGVVTAGTVNANAVTASSVTAPAMNAGSITSTSTNTGALNASSATANSLSSAAIAASSLTLGNGTAILGHLSAVVLLDFAPIPASSCSTLSSSLAGASDGDTVALGIPGVLGPVDGVTWFAWVSAADTVSVRGCNATLTATVDPPPATVRVDVWKH